MLRRMILWAASALLVVGALPATAQIREIDPNVGIDSDLQSPPPPQDRAEPGEWEPVESEPATPPPASAPAAGAPSRQGALTGEQARDEASETFKRDDLVGAAEGVFGAGAKGLAGLIEKILRDQGEPNAYIAGREASGAIIFGLRYGSGKMVHRSEGMRKVYWTGPSVGFDIGGDAGNVFVLVYNLDKTKHIFKRFAAGEGRAYLVGGFSVSYLRRGNVVLIPVRTGVGWRLGANVGYMKFTRKSRWLPF